MQLFGTKGQKLLRCPGTKGQRNKLKILPRDGMGRDSQNLGRDGPGKPKSDRGFYPGTFAPALVPGRPVETLTKTKVEIRTYT